jgi:hypothetical protein
VVPLVKLVKVASLYSVPLREIVEKELKLLVVEYYNSLVRPVLFSL